MFQHYKENFIWKTEMENMDLAAEGEDTSAI